MCSSSHPHLLGKESDLCGFPAAAAAAVVSAAVATGDLAGLAVPVGAIDTQENDAGS